MNITLNSYILRRPQNKKKKRNPLSFDVTFYGLLKKPQICFSMLLFLPKYWKQIWIQLHRKVGPIVRWERTCHQHLKRCWKMHFCHRYILTSVLFTHQQPQQSCSGSFLGNLQNVLQTSLPKPSTSLDMDRTIQFDC